MIFSFQVRARKQKQSCVVLWWLLWRTVMHGQNVSFFISLPNIVHEPRYIHSFRLYLTGQTTKKVNTILWLFLRFFVSRQANFGGSLLLLLLNDHINSVYSHTIKEKSFVKKKYDEKKKNAEILHASKNVEKMFSLLCWCNRLITSIRLATFKFSEKVVWC